MIRNRVVLRRWLSLLWLVCSGFLVIGLMSCGNDDDDDGGMLPSVPTEEVLVYFGDVSLKIDEKKYEGTGRGSLDEIDFLDRGRHRLGLTAHGQNIRHLHFEVDISGTGIYKLASPHIQDPVEISMDNGRRHFESTDGKIEIKTISEKQIKGSFQFKAVDSDGKAIEVSDGAFSLRFDAEATEEANSEEDGDWDPSHVIEPGTDLRKANLSAADLSGANLTGANLSEANLTGADLTGANLSGAKLVKANLTDATLAEANLLGANLKDAIVTGATFKEAIYDEQTILPDGFDPQAAGMVRRDD